MPRFKTLARLSALLLLICCFCTSSEAQLSGDVDLGEGTAKPEGANEANIKEITVTGIGTTLESAEKQALASAIRQAVGAYMDSKTIIENEQVIQDRILSVSNAFVEKYEVVGQPKKSSDGLVEITILARVKTNQVVQALKENNLISSEVAGQNLWAEASTKVMNAQDAVAMLEAKIPELIKSVVTITPLDDKGLPKVAKDSTGKEVSSTAPAKVEEDATTGEATLTWYLEMGVDRKYYNETLLPMVAKCLDAIMGVPSKVARLRMFNNKCLSDILPIQTNYTWLPEPEEGLPSPNQYGIALIKNISRNFDSVEFAYYPNHKNHLFIEIKDYSDRSRIFCFLNLKVLSSSGELLATEEIPAWQPFAINGSQISMIGPFTKCDDRGDLCLINPIIQEVKIKVPIELLKEIKKIEISLDPVEPKLVLQPAGGVIFNY